MPGDATVLRAENARLREAVERLRLLGEDKDRVIAGLRARNAELEEWVARLERLISRNSGNSSMPPSSDDLPGRKPPERKPRRGGGKRKPGKQPGAPGAYLPWNGHPDATNNQAERDARPAKTQQKISGRLRSETTTRHRYAVRGYASTAAKHGHAVFTAIRDALAGNPWIPPVPADA